MMYLLVNTETNEVRGDYEDTRDMSAAQMAADFLYDCTCDEDVDIDEWGLYSFCPYGQNVYDLRAKYDRNATERMAQWFKKMEAQEGEV